MKGKPRSSTTPLIPTCSKMEDLYPLTIDMLCHLGPALHSDPILIAKLLRLGRLFFKERASIKASGELPSQEKVRTGHYLYYINACNNVHVHVYPALHEASLNGHIFSSVGPLTLIFESLEIGIAVCLKNQRSILGLFLTKYHGLHRFEHTI